MFNFFKARKENMVHVVEWYDFRTPDTIYTDTMTDRGISNCVMHDVFFTLVSVDGEKVMED